MECIFCKIIKGEIPSYTVYEDEIVKVIMDINPITNGHLLILPKEHFVNLEDIEINTLSHIQNIAKKMYQLLKDKLNIDGLSLTQNNEYGQEVKHYHLHLIPRYINDNINFIPSNEKEDVEKIFTKITE